LICEFIRFISVVQLEQLDASLNVLHNALLECLRRFNAHREQERDEVAQIHAFVEIAIPPCLPLSTEEILSHLKKLDNFFENNFEKKFQELDNELKRVIKEVCAIFRCTCYDLNARIARLRVADMRICIALL
jgi:hypothetical protein